MTEKLKIDLYDEVLLKDGREGTIIEKFSDRDFMADIRAGDDWEFPFITIDDIEKVTRRSKKTEEPKKA